jgi:hypothetical protein
MATADIPCVSSRCMPHPGPSTSTDVLMLLRWDPQEVEQAVAFAVQLASDPRPLDDRLLADARHGAGYLAVVRLTTHRDGVLTPMELNSVVPVSHREYFARGAAWWPDPGAPRWQWAVGRIPPADKRAVLRQRPDNKWEKVPVRRDGWFAELVVARADETELVMAVNDSMGLRPM